MSDWRLLDLATAFGQVANRRRLALGLTAAAVARAAGMTRPAYSRTEAGIHEPTLSTMIRVSQALGADPGEIFSEAVRVAKERAT